MTPDKYPVDEDIIDPDMRGEGGGCLLLTVFTLSLILHHRLDLDGVVR